MREKRRNIVENELQLKKIDIYKNVKSMYMKESKLSKQDLKRNGTFYYICRCINEFIKNIYYIIKYNKIQFYKYLHIHFLKMSILLQRSMSILHMVLLCAKLIYLHKIG